MTQARRAGRHLWSIGGRVGPSARHGDAEEAGLGLVISEVGALIEVCHV